MQIKDCIVNVMSNPTILDYIPDINLPSLARTINLDYSNRYINDYLILDSDYNTFTNISDTVVYLTNVLNRYKYTKLYATLSLNYNPIWNVDGTEITEHLGSDTSTNVENGTHAHTGRDTTTTSNNQSTTNVENGTHAHTGRDTTTTNNNQSTAMGGSDTTSDTSQESSTNTSLAKTNSNVKHSSNTNTTNTFDYGGGETTTTVDLTQKGKLTVNGGFDSGDYGNIKSGNKIDITVNANKLVDSTLEIDDNLNHQGMTESKSGGHKESTVGKASDNYTQDLGLADDNYTENTSTDSKDTTHDTTTSYGKTETITNNESNQMDYNTLDTNKNTNSETISQTESTQIDYNTVNSTENTNTETKNYNSTDRVTRQGNIGVTSTQSLIIQEREVATFGLYYVIAKDIVDFICTADYGYC